MKEKYTMKVKTSDGYVEVEVSKEVHDFDIKNRREFGRISKQMQRNNYSLYATVYEGSEFGFYDTYPCEENEEKLEEQKLVQKCLVALKKLTPIQKRRFLMYALENYTYKKIAEIEGVDTKTVYESIQSAMKKIKKFCESTPKNS